MVTIDQLLAFRNSKRGRKSGDKAKAAMRSNQSRHIAEHYIFYDEVRPHLFHQHDYPSLPSLSKGNTILPFLEDQGWIKRKGQDAWQLVEDSDVHSYLSGGWLEEYVYLAYEAAGFNEAYFGQEIDWSVGGIHGNNEIDVIARRGSVLSFCSCKTIKTQKSNTHSEQLRSFLNEADYWNIHFANDQGRALLVVTADFIDEMRGNRHRYPQLIARATILDVSIASLEALKWERLISLIENHWLDGHSDDDCGQCIRSKQHVLEIAT